MSTPNEAAVEAAARGIAENVGGYIDYYKAARAALTAALPVIREGIAAEVLAEMDQMLGQDWSELGRYALQSARSRVARTLSTAKEATT